MLLKHVDRMLKYVNWMLEHVDWMLEHVDWMLEHAQRMLEHVDWMLEHVDWMLEHAQRMLEHVDWMLENVDWRQSLAGLDNTSTDEVLQIQVHSLIIQSHLLPLIVRTKITGMGIGKMVIGKMLSKWREGRALARERAAIDCRAREQGISFKGSNIIVHSRCEQIKRTNFSHGTRKNRKWYKVFITRLKNEKNNNAGKYYLPHEKNNQYRKILLIQLWVEVYRFSAFGSADFRMNFDIRIRNISCGCHADIPNKKRKIFRYN